MNKEVAFLFTGLIFQKEVEEKTVRRLSDTFGKVIVKSDTIPFDFTDYYNREMGEGLLREWIFFDCRIRQETIADIKHKTILIEEEFSKNKKRNVNIDPGYITLSKVVLPTTKDCAHRIYLGNDIYAEVTLIFYKGEWQSQKWTYRDYKTETAISFFNECRQYILHDNSAL